MSESSIISRFIGEVKREQGDLAEASMLRPKKELFDLGQASGNYQGLQKALEILDSILSDEAQKEKSS